MLHKDFYTTSHLQLTEGLITATITFNTAHAIFKGHFPSIPVVPGVCMIQIVKETLELQLLESLRLTKASQVKFLTLITPAEVPTVNLKINFTSQDGSTDMQAEFYNSERTFFKMKATFLAETLPV